MNKIKKLKSCFNVKTIFFESKGKTIKIAKLLFSMLMLFNVSMAQNTRPVDVISVGVGYSLADQVIASWTATNAHVYYEDLVKVKSIPVITASYEKGIAQKFSIGFAASYESLTLAYKPNFEIPDRYNYTRTNIAIRGLYHFVDNKHSDFYTGARIGYTIWSYNCDKETVQHTRSRSIPNMPSAQVFLGYRYFIKNVGLGAELGVGTAPYIGQVSVCYKIPSKK